MPSDPGSKSALAHGVTPFFFSDDGALFGLYHPSRSRADRDTGIVVCNPFGREQLYAHRALRHLALRLSEQGFHVLRFDYYGTGDSAGDGEGATLSRWVEDVGAAIAELEDRAGLSRVALVGLRLGGSLAWLSAVARRDVEALVLWEPIASGAAYLEELQTYDRQWRAERNIPAEDFRRAAILGFPLPPDLREELEGLALPGDARRRPARHLLLLLHGSPAPTEGAADPLGRFGARARVVHCPSPAFWRRDADGPAVVVPGLPVQQTLEWLQEALP